MHLEHHVAPSAMATMQCVHAHVAHGVERQVPSSVSSVSVSLRLARGEDGADGGAEAGSAPALSHQTRALRVVCCAASRQAFLLSCAAA